MIPRQYEVSADGKRFLLAQPLEDGADHRDSQLADAAKEGCQRALKNQEPLACVRRRVMTPLRRPARSRGQGNRAIDCS
jgi:hypothetical protein